MKFYYFISKKFSESAFQNSKVLHFLLIFGVGVGCFSLIITIAVLNGFEKLVHDKLKGFDGDLKITGEISQLSVAELERILDSSTVIPYMERRGIISDNIEHRVVTLKAIDLNKLNDLYGLKINSRHIKNDEIIIGQNIAYRLNKSIGDEVFISSPIDQTFLIGLPFQKKMKIASVFSTNILDYDDRFVFLSLDMGHVLFKRKQNIDGYIICLNESNNLLEIKSNLRNKLSNKIDIKSWEDLNFALVNAMKIERRVAILILSLIFLVASFNIASILSLISLQKIKNIGILKILGARSEYLKISLFLIGFKKGSIGIILGCFFGVFVVFLQNQFNFIPIPEEVYFIDSLPMALYMKDIIIVFIISIIFVLFGCLFSSHRVTGLKAINALNWVK